MYLVRSKSSGLGIFSSLPTPGARNGSVSRLVFQLGELKVLSVRGAKATAPSAAGRP